MRTWIKDVCLVNEGAAVHGSLVMADDRIAEVLTEGATPALPCEVVMDGEGAFLLPGVIDDHVHFRDPGLTHKADMVSESRAAAAGGVTSFLDMPNTVPQTTTPKALEEKYRMAAERCRVNFGFFFGATNDNMGALEALPVERIPGIKLFMGSSTGNMLVDRREALEVLFSKSKLPIMAHCEDSVRINERMAECKARYGEDPEVKYHPVIRDAEACYRSSALAVELARRYGARLHLAHVTTERELELLDAVPLTAEKRITAEACVAHLWFCDEDYGSLGTRIKCNPAVKSAADRAALRAALLDGRIDVVGTDHAPHLLSEKVGGAAKAVSGMPMVQFSLTTMLELVEHGVLSLPLLVEKMCHAPARLFGIQERGFLKPGFKADLVLVSKSAAPWVLSKEMVISKCGWSPLEGASFHWKVLRTFVNGQCVYENGIVHDDVRGEELAFLH